MQRQQNTAHRVLKYQGTRSRATCNTQKEEEVWGLRGLHSLSHYLGTPPGTPLKAIAVVAEDFRKPRHFAGVPSSNCELYTSLRLLLCVEATNTMSPTVVC